MAALLVLAFMVGGAIRFNIRHFEPIENKGHGAPQVIAFLSRIVLTGAYFISITYYLQLLAVRGLLRDPRESQLENRYDSEANPGICGRGSLGPVVDRLQSGISGALGHQAGR